MRKKTGGAGAERYEVFLLLVLQLVMFACVRVSFAFRNVSELTVGNTVAVAFDSLGMVVNILLFFGFTRSSRKSREFSLVSATIFCTSLYLMLDSLSRVVDGVAKMRTANAVINTLLYCFVPLIFIAIMEYEKLRLGVSPGKKGGALTKLTLALSALCILSVIGNLPWKYYFSITPDGFYKRSETYYLSLIIPILLASVCVVYVFIQKVPLARKAVIVSYPMIPFVLMALTSYITGMSLNYITVFCMSVMFFGVIYASREEELENQKHLYMKQRVELMSSQIRSHFVSNTLLTIRGMYREEPDKADAVMNDFIMYLQHSFREVSDGGLVPASKELEHTRHYTNIEQARFPDISVEYQITAPDFSLPAITVQPIVENAIRHGLMPLESGGKVTVSSDETETDYRIIVADNGVGFDPASLGTEENESGKHIGIPNVRDRLSAFGGTLTVESGRGSGTKVTITMPKTAK